VRRGRVGLRRRVRLGSLRRTTPVSDRWGWDRGTPIDRYYIEAFLDEHRGDIRGRVLEVRDRRYTERFGSDVHESDVLDIDERNADATLLADLTATDELPEDRFDCFILVQTLQYIYDVEAAVRSAHRLLRRGGVVLVTVPAVSRIARSAGVDGDYWRFTAASSRRLFAGVFGEENVEVRSYGNVLTGAAFLMGLAAEELSAEELRSEDEFFPVLVAVRAVRASKA
jgi:SAM-dependent methyltransferase